MTTPSIVPATKPEPVQLYGLIITVLLAVGGGITTVTGPWWSAQWWAGVISLLIAVVNAAKDFYVRGQVIPAADVTAYINDDRTEVAGPASAAVTGTPVESPDSPSVAREMHPDSGGNDGPAN